MTNNKFPRHDDAWYRARLAPPRGRPRIVIDTDAANEIDDQFALAWALLSPAQLDIAAVYAAPFSFAHRRAALSAGRTLKDPAPFNPPGIGMQRSYAEILHVYSLLGIEPAASVFRGSEGYLPSADQPLASAAADDLIAQARAMAEGEPLYVVALGCVTNIASALLLAPDLVDRIVVVWTSGYPSHAPQVNDSFNLEQDMSASQVLLDSGVPHIYLPGYQVGAQLRLSLPEIERHVSGCGAMGDYLHHLYTHNPLWDMLGQGQGGVDASGMPGYSWVIWDIINIAWLIQPAWVPSELVRTPRLGDDRRWRADATRHLMREAYGVQRNAIFADLFGKLALARPLRSVSDGSP
jgi:purine nucleosidase